MTTLYYLYHSMTTPLVDLRY